MPSWLLNQVGLRAGRLVTEQLGGGGSRTAFAVLAAVEEFGPMSQIELGRRLGLDRSDVAVVLDRLGSDGLAERRPDRHDRRRNVIHLTATGRGALGSMQLRVDRAQAELLAPLDDAERRQLTRLLQRLVDHGTADD